MVIRKFSWIVATAALLCTAHAKACDCVWGGAFRTVSAKADLVAAVRVEAYGPKLARVGDNVYEYMEVSVLEVLAGEEVRRSLRVYGDDGAQCRPYIVPRRFAPGTEFVMALHREQAGKLPFLGASDYDLSNCGEYWLARKDGKVTGFITDGSGGHTGGMPKRKPDSMDYQALRALFLEHGDDSRK